MSLISTTSDLINERNLDIRSRTTAFGVMKDSSRVNFEFPTMSITN